MNGGASTGEHWDLDIRARGGIGRYWYDVWRYRELFFFLAWRDVLVRYKQTVIGLLWAIVRPLLTTVVFTVVLHLLAALPADAGAPYALMVLTAMLPWQLFSNALQEGTGSLVANAALVTKVYFPRIIVPASTIVAGLVDFLVGAALLGAMMLWYGWAPTWRLLVLPLCVLQAILASMGAGLLFASLSAKYRDFRYVVPFIVQLGLYVSPVGFSSAVVPESWRILYSLNPMVGVIDGFRWAVLGRGASLHLAGLMASTLSALLIAVVGVTYFRRTERVLADVI